MTDNARTDLQGVYLPLRLTYGLLPVAAGLDKFTNLLADWQSYLWTSLAETLPVSPAAFMHIVGMIEIVAGLTVLAGLTRLGGFVVAGWLVLIAVVAATAGYYDIARSLMWRWPSGPTRWHRSQRCEAESFRFPAALKDIRRMLGHTEEHMDALELIDRPVEPDSREAPGVLPGASVRLMSPGRAEKKTRICCISSLAPPSVNADRPAVGRNRKLARD